MTVPASIATWSDVIFQDTIPPHNEFNLQFLDLLKRIFVYDPSKRISAKEALNHPWFDQRIEDDGTEALKIRKKQEKVKVERARQQERENGYR